MTVALLILAAIMLWVIYCSTDTWMSQLLSAFTGDDDDALVSVAPVLLCAVAAIAYMAIAQHPIS